MNLSLYSKYLNLYQHHTVLIAIVSYSNWKSCNASSSHLCFSVRIILAVLDILISI